MNGGQSVYLMFPASADVQVSLGDKGGETHTNSIKELCKRTDFPRPPKAMEEELEHPLLGVGKPLVLTPIAMEDHRSKRKPLEDLGAWGVEQERDLCDSGTQRPGLLEGIPREAEPPKPHFKASVSPSPRTPSLRNLRYSSLPTWVHDCCLLFFTSQGSFLCSKKVTRFSLETARPVY